MDYIHLSLSVSWRFINLGFAFNNVFGPSTRSLFVYSDVGASNVLGLANSPTPFSGTLDAGRIWETRPDLIKTIQAMSSFW